jgi:UDP-N-acetylmuramyl pentapeptide phosphotransferase/UDP-N-acetylglucosamine-1-phosphate transferase
LKIFHAFLFGAFWLILAYLAFNHIDGVNAVMVGTKVTSIDEIKALQGRAVAYA